MSAASDLSGRHTDTPGREGWVTIRTMVDGIARVAWTHPPRRGLGGSRAVARTEGPKR